MTSLIAQANGDVQVLQSRVETAMAILDVAMETRDNTENILSESFRINYEANQLKITELQYASANILIMQGTMADFLTRSQQDVAVANVTLQSMRRQASLLASQTTDDVVTSQQLRLNATTVTSLVDVAYNDVMTFKALSDEIKQNMTSAYETVVLYTELTNQMEENMTQVYRIVGEINAISLPDLQEMQELAAQIRETQFSSEFVSEATARAEIALDQANNVNNISQYAAELSLMAYDELTQIQANLVVSAQSRDAAMATVDTIDNMAQDIQFLLDDVVTKSSAASALGDVTAVTLSNLDTAVSTVDQCFDELTANISVTNELIATLNEDIDESTQTLTSNSRLLDEVNNVIAQKSLGVNAAYEDYVTLSNEVTDLEQQLTEVESIVDLQELQNQYNDLVEEMTTVENELIEMESLVNQLLDEINTLTSSSSTSCIHN